MTRPVDERGSVSIVLVALLGVVVVLAMGLADVGSALVAAARAQDAADSAALAAAQQIAIPSGRTPAELATEYAARNGGSIVRCACDPATFEATVTVGVPVGPLLLFADDRTAQASARAVVAEDLSPGASPAPPAEAPATPPAPTAPARGETLRESWAGCTMPRTWRAGSARRDRRDGCRGTVGRSWPPSTTRWPSAP